MQFVHIEGRRYGQFARLGDEPDLIHAFSTRPVNVYSGDDPQTGERRRSMAQD